MTSKWVKKDPPSNKTGNYANLLKNGELALQIYRKNLIHFFSLILCFSIKASSQAIDEWKKSFYLSKTSFFQ